MIDKTTTADKALANVRGGASVMLGGFGSPGTPFTLIRALLARGLTGLTLIKNDANEQGIGISTLIEAGCAERFVVSHMGLNGAVIEMMNRGELEVEMHPQGLLAEKIRAGGAGLPGLLTDIGLETILREQKETIQFQGRTCIVEPSLRADAALIHAARADRWGNLVFEKTARNFNPLMATASDLVIVEALEIVETGALDPDAVHLPGAFVDHVVPADTRNEAYGVLKHHVL
ncbi:CoA transferase subunit A [Paucidesulfovibrio longus]|uniref:CoA transferase subunit A n=1 Tax=Paucidesulfovibrio longus TaxID=889 RepID=UPI0003B56448|nr:CoA transferase subunit A [Paucidesulfovibrio longus]